MFTQLISDARAAEYELVEPGDEDRLFYKLPWWKKVIVMAGGPTVNLVLAFLLFGGVFMLHGPPEPTTTVDEVSDCVIAVTPETLNQAAQCTPADPVAPAKPAGLQPGDRILDLQRHRGDLVGPAVGPDPGQRRRPGGHRLRARRRAPERHDQHHRLAAPGPTATTSRSSRSASSAVAPTMVLERQDAGFVVDHDGRPTPGRPSRPSARCR